MDQTMGKRMAQQQAMSTRWKMSRHVSQRRDPGDVCESSSSMTMATLSSTCWLIVVLVWSGEGWGGDGGQGACASSVWVGACLVVLWGVWVCVCVLGGKRADLEEEHGHDDLLLAVVEVGLEEAPPRPDEEDDDEAHRALDEGEEVVDDGPALRRALHLVRVEADGLEEEGESLEEEQRRHHVVDRVHLFVGLFCFVCVSGEGKGKGLWKSPTAWLAKVDRLHRPHACMVNAVA